MSFLEALDGRPDELFLFPKRSDALMPSMEDGFAVDLDFLFRLDTADGTPVKEWKKNLKSKVAEFFHACIMPDESEEKVETFVGAHVALFYRSYRNGIPSVRRLLRDDDMKALWKHGFPSDWSDDDPSFPLVFFEIVNYHFPVLPKSVDDCYQYEGLIPPSPSGASSVASSRAASSKLGFLSKDPFKNNAGFNPMHNSTSKTSKDAPDEIVVDSSKSDKAKLDDDDLNGDEENEADSKTRGIPSALFSTPAAARVTRAALRISNIGIGLVKSNASLFTPLRSGKSATKSDNAGGKGVSSSGRSKTYFRGKEVVVPRKDNPFDVITGQPKKQIDPKSTSDSKAPQEALLFNSLPHPHVPDLPYVSYNPEDEIVITSTGCVLNLASKDGDYKAWKNLIPRLKSNSKPHETYAWYCMLQTACCAEGYFLPPFEDFLGGDSGFPYQELFPSALHPTLQNTSVQLFNLIKAYGLPEDDAEMTQLAVGVHSSGFALISLILEGVHPLIGNAGEVPSERFDYQWSGEDYLSLKSRVTFRFALKRIEHPEMEFDAHRIVRYIVDHIHGDKRREYIWNRFEQEWHHNNKQKRELYNTEARLFKRIGDFYKQAPKPDRRRFAGAYSKPINTISTEEGTPICEEIADDTESEEYIVAALASDDHPAEEVDRFIDYCVHQVAASHGSEPNENLFTSECLVCKRHPNTMKCNDVVRHLLRDEVLKQPKLAAQFRSMMQKRHRKALEMIQSYGGTNPDFP